jgi:hypothetical protein
MNWSAAALVRGWVDLYTRGLPAEVRAARRDEVDDDLWSQHSEAEELGRSPRSVAGEVLVRLLLGMPSDLSWRLSHGRTRGAPAPERSASMSIRVVGALALLGGASWAALIILVLAFGDAVYEGPGAGVFLALGAAGSLGLAAAAIGLIWQFQERVGPLGSLGGVLAGSSAFLGTVGAYGAIVFLPIGSAMLAWDLARSGVLSRSTAIVHVLSSGAFLITAVQSQIDYTQAIEQGLFIALAVPYALTWIAIGASVFRGLPRNHEPATGS